MILSACILLAYDAMILFKYFGFDVHLYLCTYTCNSQKATGMGSPKKRTASREDAHKFTSSSVELDEVGPYLLVISLRIYRPKAGGR